MAITFASNISYENPIPERKEYLDAIVRHICQILGFGFGYIDLINNNEAINIASFVADDLDYALIQQLKSLEDENGQALAHSGSILSSKAIQTRLPVISFAHTAISKEAEDIVSQSGQSRLHLPYAIVPVMEGIAPNESLRALVRVVGLDGARELTAEDMQAVSLNGQRLISQLPQLDVHSKQGNIIIESGDSLESFTIVVHHANRLFRRKLSRALKERYEVLECDSEDRAVELLRDEKVDLIVLDSSAEEATGYSFVKAIKAEPQWTRTPVVLTSQESEHDKRVEALEAGADDVIFESCHESEILARLKSLLRHRKTELELSMQLKLLEDYAQKLESVHEEMRKNEERKLYIEEDLRLSKLEADRLRNQEQLLLRISDIIRRSPEIDANIADTLEALAGYLNLDTCFVVMPETAEQDDAIFNEYCEAVEFSVQSDDLDLVIFNTFKQLNRYEHALVIDDFQRDGRVSIFREQINWTFMPKSAFYIPITSEKKLLGILGGHRIDTSMHWTKDNVSFLRQVGDQLAQGVTNARLYLRLQRQATTDGLTGLFNHRTGQEKLSEQLRMAERYQRNLALVMIDVDHFKNVNDSHGHPAGDTVLKAVAELIRSDCRDVDIPVRYGGEEFLLVLPEVSAQGAIVLAERLRKRLEELQIRHEDLTLSVTASIGVAAYPDDASEQDQLLSLADKALYMSKRHGRNQVSTVQDLPSTKFAQAASPLHVVSSDEQSSAEQFKKAQEAISLQEESHRAKAEDVEQEAPQSLNTPEVVALVKSLAQLLYSKSEYAKQHHLETARYADLLAKVMGLSEKQIEEIRVASLLHDVGIVSIPDEVINKPGYVTQEEMKLIMEHPTLGADMIRPISALKGICDVIECHQECWDGTGYPRGLKGEAIPLAARIVALVDAYHAMISDRPWRSAMSDAQARQTLKNGAGFQWDPYLVDVFLAILDSLDEEKKLQEAEEQAPDDKL